MQYSTRLQVFVGVMTYSVCQQIREVSGSVVSVVHAVPNVQAKFPRHGDPVHLEKT